MQDGAPTALKTGYRKNVPLTDGCRPWIELGRRSQYTE
jgi:hypothetical protein